jgi:hypothetical protein
MHSIVQRCGDKSLAVGEHDLVWNPRRQIFCYTGDSVIETSLSVICQDIRMVIHISHDISHHQALVILVARPPSGKYRH